MVDSEILDVNMELLSTFINSLASCTNFINSVEVLFCGNLTEVQDKSKKYSVLIKRYFKASKHIHVTQLLTLTCLRTI